MVSFCYAILLNIPVYICPVLFDGEFLLLGELDLIIQARLWTMA